MPHGPKMQKGLLGAISAATLWLEASSVPFAIIGGVAASLHGKPRLTKDVDLVALAEEDSWPNLLLKAEAFGLRARMADAIDFARITRVLLLVHEPTGIDVDLSFGMLPFEHEVVVRAKQRSVREVSFPLATAEDIVIMKALALRPRDTADIEGIVESVRNLDLSRVRRVVAQLSLALEGEDHAARLEDILLRVRTR